MLKGQDAVSKKGKKEKKGKTKNKPKLAFEWLLEADRAFQKLKTVFAKLPVLQHFNRNKLIVLRTDASGFAIAGIINQFDSFGELRPVSFYF